MIYKEVQACRICKNTNLVTILDLGSQALTGVFPKPGETVPVMPVELVKCHGNNCCGLVQIRHSADANMMYGDNYGYRSGLNKSMVEHLQDLATYSLEQIDVCEGDLILDIGSNDGTLLNSYANVCFENGGYVTKVGMDPTIKKFGEYYNPDIIKIPDFFTKDKFISYFNDPNRRAKIITSISMFYDLEDPQKFVEDVADILHPEGVWVFEQSYSLAMLAKNMYDVAAQEHLLYYSLKQVQWLLDRAFLKIIDININDCNAGSFRITAASEWSSHAVATEKVDLIVNQEKMFGLDGLSIYKYFAENAAMHKSNLRKLLQDIKKAKKTIYGLGASTKFNVVLQFCEIDTTLLPAIGEVNEDKFGRETPGTHIPIISEQEVINKNPDYLLVGIYQFRDFILNLPHIKKYIDGGGKVIFPLPTIEIIEK